MSPDDRPDTRTWALLLALVLMVGAAVLWLREPGAQLLVEDSVASPPPAAAPEDRTGEEGDTRSLERARFPERAPLEITSPRTAVGRSRSDGVLRGTLVVEGEDEPAQGSFVLGWRRGTKERELLVRVRDGQWEAELSKQAEVLYVDAISLSGLAAEAIDPDGLVPAAKLDELHISCRLVPMGTLRVLDAQTLSHLRDVRILRWQGRSGPYPVTSSFLVDGAASPLEMGALLASGTFKRSDRHFCLVSSPGYTWARARLEPAGVTTVHLERGGSLEVNILGEMPDHHNARLLCRLNGKKRLFSVPLGDSRERAFDHVPPGEYEVSVKVGAASEDPLAVGTVSVVAGEVSVLALHLAPMPTLPMASLGGLLVMPEEWGLKQFRLEVVCLGLRPPEQQRVMRLPSRDMVRVDPESWSWSGGLVSVGKYELRVRIGEWDYLFELWQSEVDVPDHGIDDVVIRVPPPALVRVTTDFPASPVECNPDTDYLVWHVNAAGGESFKMVSCPEPGGPYEFTAPQGEIRLRVFADGYAYGDATAWNGPGMTEVSVQLRPTERIVVDVLREGKPLEDANRLREALRIRAVGHEGSITAITTDSDYQGGHRLQFRGIAYTVSHPGRYRIDVTSLPGLADSPAVMVEVGPSETVTHVIELSVDG